VNAADVSVVVCVHNGAAGLRDCLAGLAAQSLRRDRFELLVVDDGSTDGSGDVAAHMGARVVAQPHRGLSAARNNGWRSSSAKWIAYIDADCAPTRKWLEHLLAACEGGSEGPRLGAAGSVRSFPSRSDVSRFVELIGGFNTEDHLAHPLFPYAPMGNVVYRRAALEAVGGIDERYVNYEGCDLHTRMRRSVGGEFVYEPRAILLHRHPESWRSYARQQRRYGRGLAQFSWHYREEIGWTVGRELAAWLALVPAAARALAPGEPQARLVRRGIALKRVAQRVGFAETYWRPAARRTFLVGR
jgi:glycosyltransferase involved in cell wall biosynthesis